MTGGEECNSHICVAIHYLATTFFSPTCPKLGGPFMNAPRAIFCLFFTIFPFLRPRTTSLNGEKIKCWKCPWRATFGPRLRGLAGHLPRHRGPFLTCGPGIKNYCFRVKHQERYPVPVCAERCPISAQCRSRLSPVAMTTSQVWQTCSRRQLVLCRVRSVGSAYARPHCSHRNLRAPCNLR